jgi:hypothetical protein
MLERVDQVDWASLRDAYGPATAIPEALHGLCSEDEETRMEAFSVLQSNVWHQGDIYEVTPHVVPFLLELAEGDPELIEYLGVLAQSARRYLQRPEPEARALGAAVLSALVQGLPRIKAWMEEDPEAALLAELLEEEPLPGAPAWAKHFAKTYLSGSTTIFLLHGAVRSPQSFLSAEGTPRSERMERYLAEELFGARQVVLFYDLSAGVRGANETSRNDYLRYLAAYDAVLGSTYAQAPPRAPTIALQHLQNYLRMRAAEGVSLCLVIDYLDAIAPAGEFAQLSEADRFVIVTLLRWAEDAQLRAADVTLVLLADDLGAVSSRLTRSEHIAVIEVPPPVTMEGESPWETVLELLDGEADGLALMKLWEYANEELLANGRSIVELLSVEVPSERPVAALIAERMSRRFPGGSAFTYTHFYGPSRGIDPSEEEIRQFVERCEARGIRLTYGERPVRGA